MTNENIVNNETLQNPDAVKVQRTKKLYSIFDRARMAYLSAMEKPNHQTAIRDFAIMCKNKEGLLFQSPDDFKLYYLGYMNEETGELVSEMTKLADATEYVGAQTNE